MKVRVVRPHVARLKYHEWVESGWVKADKLGRLNPRMIDIPHWIVMVCNNPECPGEARVHDSLIKEAIQARINQKVNDGSEALF